ncbi:MAG: HlyD family efflux transporter periplasmic adaptor subunit [Nitrospira sp.]|nr:HlyD family efflux transporter periplasmic adaptor subunit [Nitrospira sp.]
MNDIFMSEQRGPQTIVPPESSILPRPVTLSPDLAELIKKAATAEQLKIVLELVSAAVASGRFAEAARAFVTELATRLACDRVSFGAVTDGRIEVKALSHSATFSAKTNLIRAGASAMEESLDQRQTIVVPPLPTSPTQVIRAHEELARQFGAFTLCSVPLVEQGRVIGVLTLERGTEQPFDRRELDLLEAVGAVVGPILEVKRRDDRWLTRKAWESFRAQISKLVGPRHVGFKLAALTLTALTVFVLFVKGDYRVTAKTVLEGSVQRAAVAPFQGYLETAPVRAGDVVQAGQVLATLQDHDLRLERLRWISQRDQLAKEHRQVMADRDAAKVEIKAAELAQAEAQLALATDKLARAQIIAPFAGIVVTGDWSQQLGSPVDEGRVLFELAPLDEYRIILQVDERDIAPIRTTQAGTLLLSALPYESMPFKVTKITPVSTAKEGRNFFRVEAAFAERPSERLRPAMEGIAKIEVDRRLLVWIWTHEAVDWARLKLWSWLP